MKKRHRGEVYDEYKESEIIKSTEESCRATQFIFSSAYEYGFSRGSGGRLPNFTFHEPHRDTRFWRAESDEFNLTRVKLGVYA